LVGGQDQHAAPAAAPLKLASMGGSLPWSGHLCAALWLDSDNAFGNAHWLAGAVRAMIDVVPLLNVRHARVLTNGRPGQV
jgi:hypothetical protein